MTMGHGAMAAHQTLDLWILVRLQVPQLYDESVLPGALFCWQPYYLRFPISTTRKWLFSRAWMCRLSSAVHFLNYLPRERVIEVNLRRQMEIYEIL